MPSPLRLGTRGSELARWQADFVASALRADGTPVETVIIETTGDRRDGPLVNLGAQGLFTKELQLALLAEEIDVAVHSLKDLPTEPVAGLVLAATPPRGPVRDALVATRYAGLTELPEGAVIGTGSVRREAQLRRLFGDRFTIRGIRGNIGTRLAKLDRGEYDAILLAEAALVRLGMGERIACFLEPPDFFPAIGQGAIGLEIRADNHATASRLAQINHTPTLVAVSAERAMLLTLQGGCSAPIAAHTFYEADRLVLRGRVLSPDGRNVYEVSSETAGVPTVQTAETLGRRVAEKLLAEGAEFAVPGEPHLP